MAVARNIWTSLAAYVRASVQNAFIVILLYCAGFAIAGVPWWALTGLACGLLNAIPQIGAVLALGFVLLVELFFTEDWLGMAYAAGVWLLVQVVEGFVLSPRAAGRAGVHPVASIFIVLIAALVFGPIGAILAVPVVAVLLIIWRAARKRP
jgi:predicted PurR-regulated permease PerM